MQSFKQKQALRGLVQKRSLRVGDPVRLTYGERGVITGFGGKPNEYLVQCPGRRPVMYRDTQFQPER